MTAVVIGIDPHKRSNTALVLDAHENVLAKQRFANDRDGYRQLKQFAQPWRDRTWAVEGARGVGLGLAQRIAGDGERVLTPTPLRSPGLRSRDLEVVEPDEVRAVLKLLSDRRQQLVDQRIVAVNRLHQLLTELIPGGAERRLTPVKARQLMSGVRPRDHVCVVGLASAAPAERPYPRREPGRYVQVGKARKQLALDHAKDVERLDAELAKVKTSISAVIAEHPTKVSDVRGVGPVMTALILGEVGDVRRFPSKAHFASYTGTAPIDVSSGDHVRHRLNRGGNRRLNYALHIAALVQVRLPGPGRDYYLRKIDTGKTPLEAMRCVKRRLARLRTLSQHQHRRLVVVAQGVVDEAQRRARARHTPSS